MAIRGESWMAETNLVAEMSCWVNPDWHPCRESPARQMEGFLIMSLDIAGTESVKSIQFLWVGYNNLTSFSHTSC